MEVYESRAKYGPNKLDIKEEFWLWTLSKLFLEPMSIMLEVIAQLTTFSHHGEEGLCCSYPPIAKRATITHLLPHRLHTVGVKLN